MTKRLSAFGYEVFSENGDLHLINRFSWNRNYSTAVFLFCALLLVFLALLVSEGIVTGAEVSPSFLFSFAVGLGIFALASRMMFNPRRRRGAPLPYQELVVSPRVGELRGGDGKVVARQESVRANVRTDWWGTWGLVRYVRLSWDGGQTIVFRSCSNRKVLGVLEALQDAGIAIGR
jgi:hypothetical protein